MRKKYIHDIFMKNVLVKDYYLINDDNINGFRAIKYIKKIKKPISAYCNGNKYVGLDDGFTILEYVPKKRNYNCRVFFNRENKPLVFYFNINKSVGKEDGLVWYDDLYLSIVMTCKEINGFGHYIILDNEKELKTAKKEGDITAEEYALAYKTAENLMEELQNGKNDIVNKCEIDIVKDKEKYDLN